jgi:hypothetical protein
MVKNLDVDGRHSAGKVVESDRRSTTAPALVALAEADYP